MYKIIGVDGKEYGPATVEQVQSWIRQGRVNAQTKIQGPNSADWQPAADFIEFRSLLLPPDPPPGVVSPPALPPSFSTSPAPAPAPRKPQPPKGLAITSFVLGILGLTCFMFLTGVPAIICGHIAAGRARRSPEQHGGYGFAVAGYVLGYVSLFYTLLVAALVIPTMRQARGGHSMGGCSSQMRQIGLAMRVWGVDHDDQFPFNVSTNQGGTLELCDRSPNGFDRNAFLHFRVISNELGKASLLVCPQDHSKRAAPDFLDLASDNVTYLLRSGSNVLDNTSEILAECPIHGTRLLGNGNIEEKPRGRGLRKKGA